MQRFIQRDWTRTEHDDWLLNIEPNLDRLTEAIFIGFGWIIQYRNE